MGAADFFGGLLEGVGNTILVKQERDYQKRLQDTQDRRALLTSVLQDPNATWGQKATALQRLGTDLSAQPEQSMAGKLMGKVRGKRGQAQPQPNPFESLVESYRNLDKAAQPPAQIAPMPQMQGLGPSAQTIAPLPQIRQGPGTPAEAEAQRASAARMSEYQQKGEADLAMDRAMFRQRMSEGQKAGLKGEALYNYAAGQNLMPGMFNRPLIGVNVPGTALPANAVDLDGKPIPPDARTAQRAFRPVQFGVDESGQPQLRYTEVMPPRSAATRDAVVTLAEAYKTANDPSVDPWMRKAAQTIVRQKELGATAGQTWRVWEDESGQHIARLPSKGGLPPLPARAPTTGTEAGGAPRLPGQIDLGPKVTSTTKTMIEAAPKVRDFVTRIRTLVNQQRAQLGPAAGRWNEFMTGKVGAPNPQFARLRTDTSLLQTLLMRMHAGARGSQYLMAHFKELMDSGRQSPENLLAAIDEIDQYAQSLQHGDGGGGGGSESGHQKGETRQYQGHTYEFDGTQWVRK